MHTKTLDPTQITQCKVNQGFFKTFLVTWLLLCLALLDLSLAMFLHSDSSAITLKSTLLLRTIKTKGKGNENKIQVVMNGWFPLDGFNIESCGPVSLFKPMFQAVKTNVLWEGLFSAVVLCLHCLIHWYHWYHNWYQYTVCYHSCLKAKAKTP